MRQSPGKHARKPNSAWEKAFRQAESELEAADSGLKKLIRRVIPSLGNSAASPSQSTIVVNEEHD